jgi:hypothetical protein
MLRALRPNVWLRWVYGLLGAGSILWIIYLYFGGTGVLALSYQFDSNSQAISPFSPHGRALDLERNQDNGETYQRLVGEPAYFTARLPGSYDRLEVQLEYQNPEQTVVELGVKQTSDKTLFDYLMKPLENKLVDDSSWSRLESDQYVLLQRTPTYDSIDDFLTQPPINASIGSYFTVPSLPFTDPTYTPNNDKGSEITTTLRGKHEFYTYAAAGEVMTFSVEAATLNYIAGDDVVSVSLDYDGAELSTSGFTNGGVANLEATAMVSGVYRLVIDCTDDVLITNITSSQERLVVGKTLHLAGSQEYASSGISINTAATTVSSDANWVTLIPKHSYAVGDYNFYDRVVTLGRIDTPITWVNPIGEREFEFVAPNNDLYLESDSYFALPGAEAFDPWFGMRPISQYTHADNLDYVFSGRYTEPTRLRGWTTASASFDLTSVTQNKPNTLQFILSAPGLSSASQGLKIRSIKVTAYQQPLSFNLLWEKLFGAN